MTDEVLAAEGLGKRFDGVVALDDVSFAVRGPGLVGVLGPNGAGKTTLLDILEGLSPATSGAYRLFGRPPAPYPRRRVGVVLQREPRLERCTAGEYAALFAAIHGVPDGAARIMARARLEAQARVALSRLSGGEAARLFIAAAVVHEPELLFLDEPTAALDPEGKREVGDLLRDLARTRTVVLTTHDLREADALCTHLLFLVGGRVRAWGPREALVAAVPPEARRGLPVEDAFFHHCAIRIVDGEAAP
ncbi:MAG: ABC transporter ATP-binding protein [Planctomycetota bacterium]|nr:ABC transporter ATP-binding protein [Planctomycetota bacterium]